MGHITATNRPLWWAVMKDGGVAEAGLTVVGDTTVSALPFISATDENDFLEAVAGKAGGYKPLPTTGTVQPGEIYGHEGGLAIVRKPHVRTAADVVDAADWISVYKAGDKRVLEWMPDEKVERGMRRAYEKQVYECIEAHATSRGKPPDRARKLWRLVDAVQAGR